MAAIELDGVVKRYGDTTALDGLDMTVTEGEVFGFLGPNGAGKSTTIDVLLDYRRPTSGQVSVLGHDPRAEPVAIRRRTGVLPEQYSPIAETTGREHVSLAIDARNADEDPDALLERVGLGGEGDREAANYSKGMVQRLALAMALVGEPDLLILDEPSSGLDPHGVRLMREIVREERDRGATVFFSSHILSQVEAVADSVGIVDEGVLVAVDTIEGLRESADTSGRLTLTLDKPVADAGAREALEGLSDVTVVEFDGPTLTVGCPDEQKAAVIDAVRGDGASVTNVETSELSLEDLFVAQTGDAA